MDPPGHVHTTVLRGCLTASHLRFSSDTSGNNSTAAGSADVDGGLMSWDEKPGVLLLLRGASVRFLLVWGSPQL